MPGTPIMPAPSRFTSATPSMQVMPLTAIARGRLGADQRARLSPARTCCGSRSGCPCSTAGAIVCGWITLAPKYASSIASLYDSESMTFASGTRRGSALSTPSTSVQMWISSASSSAPKIEPEKSLPLRPSVVCRPFGVARDEAGDDQRRRLARRDAIGVGLRHVPAHRRAERSPFHRHDVARVDPVDGAGPAAAMPQVGAEQAGRPDLAVAGDEVAHRLRGRADQLDGVQDAGDVAAVLGERREVFGACSSPASSVSAMTSCRWRSSSMRSATRPFLALGGGDEVQQRVGDAAARGQHDAEARMRILLEDAGDALHAYRIGDAGAAELMYAPPFHLPGSLVALSKATAQPPRSGADPPGQDGCRHSEDAYALGGRHSTGRASGRASRHRALLSPMYRAGRRPAARRPPLPRRVRKSRAREADRLAGSGWAVAAACSLKYMTRAGPTWIRSRCRSARRRMRRELTTQTVGAAQVEHQVLAVVVHDQRVVAADEHRVDRDVRFLAAPDQDAVGLRA